MQLTGWGTLIFLFYIAAVVAIGFYSGRKGKEGTENFFLAGRGLPWFVIGFSLIASSISTEQFIGEVGWAYKYGLAVANWEWLVWPAQAILLFFFLPIFLKNRIYTIPQLLTKRYSAFTGTLFSVVLIIMYLVVNLPLVLYSGGFLLNQIFGINLVLSIWVLVIVAGSYTIFGGLSAVAWVDLFNGALLIIGGLVLFTIGVHHVPGGLAEIIGTGDRAHLILPASHPELPWTGIMAVAIVTGGFYYTSNQFITQRCLGARSEWDGKMGVVLAGFLALPLGLSVAWPGMIAYAINPNLTQVDAAYPYLINTLVPIGLKGAFFAVLIGAIMSTTDSLTNATTSLITMDIYKPFIYKGDSDRHLVRFSQLVGILILLFGAFWAPIVGKFGTIFEYVQEIWSIMMAPCMAVFVVTIFWKRATTKAAIATLFAAFPAVPYVFMREFHGWLEGINIFNLAFIFFFLSIAFMMIMSKLTERETDPEIIAVTHWEPHMAKLRKEEREQGYPWYRWVGFWWGLIVLMFITIYAIFW